MILRTLDHRKAHDKLDREIKHAPQAVQDVVPLPPEGAILGAMGIGDHFLYDPIDNGRTDRGGTIVWLHAEPSWETPEELIVSHVWGESAKHYDILLDVCRYCVANGLGDLPISYYRSGHPLTTIADQYFTTPAQVNGKKVTTTARQALVLGLQNRPNGGGK